MSRQQLCTPPPHFLYALCCVSNHWHYYSLSVQLTNRLFINSQCPDPYRQRQLFSRPYYRPRLWHDAVSLCLSSVTYVLWLNRKKLSEEANRVARTLPCGTNSDPYDSPFPPNTGTKLLAAPPSIYLHCELPPNRFS